MAKYANKFDAVGRMKKIISKNPDIADLRTPGALINIGKTQLKDVEVRNALKNIDTQFGFTGENSFYDFAKKAADAEAIAKPGMETFEVPMGANVSASILKTVGALKKAASIGLDMSKFAAPEIVKIITRLPDKKQFEFYRAVDSFNKAKTPGQKNDAQDKIDSLLSKG